MWYCSGLGYVMSVMLEPQNSMVASVAIVLVLGGFFNGVEPRFRTLTPTMKAVFGELRSILGDTAMPQLWHVTNFWPAILTALGQHLPSVSYPSAHIQVWC